SCYCLYGEYLSCSYQCHCAVDNECSAGTCPSGCNASLPFGYNWRGSSCQIGNVDLHISTNMRAAHFYQKTYPATGAIDGIIPYVIYTHCVHLSKTYGISINWWSD
ncbi:hypothetical protein LSH36_1765g00008, partial [Paralvinella palmiformis]